MSNKKVLLIDVDGKIPNLALMRLSAYHKRMKHDVEILRLEKGGYPALKKEVFIDSSKYLKVYASVLYNWNKDVLKFSDMSNVLIGGTGYDIHSKLPPEVDAESEDYSVYSDSKIAYGFITRGCIRKCGFCVVPEKEGMIHKVNDIDDIFNPNTHKILYLMDNNILAYPDHEKILTELRDRKIQVHFNSGLDIRLATDTNLKLLSELNYYGNYLFSFDLPKQHNEITEKAKLVKKYINKKWELKMCLLVGWKSTLGEDIGRILWCLERKILPYIMRHEKCWNSENREFYIDLAAWANQAGFVKTLTFKQFLFKRHINKKGILNMKRISNSLNNYNKSLPEALEFIKKAA